MAQQKNNPSEKFKALLKAEKEMAFTKIESSFGTIAARRAAEKKLHQGATFIEFAQTANEIIEAYAQASISDLILFSEKSGAISTELMNEIGLNATDLKMRAIKIKSPQNLIKSLKQPHLESVFLTKMGPSTDRVALMLRRLALGIFPTNNRENMTVNNNVVNVKNLSGQVVQGNENEFSYNHTEMKFEEIRTIVSDIESKINKSEPSPELIDLQADIEVIKIQLNKSTPSKSILKSAVESMKTISEGALGGALGSQLPPLISSLTALIQ